MLTRMEVVSAAGRGNGGAAVQGQGMAAAATLKGRAVPAGRQDDPALLKTQIKCNM